MPTRLSPDVHRFVTAYETAGNSGDAESVGRMFDDVFMSADPNGVSVVPVKAPARSALDVRPSA
jgi:hypothetical protein